jgi:hypothetical protein
MLWLLCVGCSSASAQSPHTHAAARTGGYACPHDDSGLELPSGFCATVFADGIGHARHLVVAPNGVVYVNTWSGRYYGNDTPHTGGFLVGLQDTTGSGNADMTGVPQPKDYRSPMPPMGGAQLTPDQVSAVAAYVWSLGGGR